MCLDLRLVQNVLPCSFLPLSGVYFKTDVFALTFDQCWPWGDGGLPERDWQAGSTDRVAHLCLSVCLFVFILGGSVLLFFCCYFLGGVAGGCWMVLKEEVTSHQVFYSVTSLYQSGSCISSSRCWFWWGGLSGGVLLLRLVRLWPRTEPECPYCWTYC